MLRGSVFLAHNMGGSHYAPRVSAVERENSKFKPAKAGGSGLLRSGCRPFHGLGVVVTD